VATRVEEMEGLRADLSLSGVLAVGLVLLSLRWFFAPVVGADPRLPLLCGTLTTFGVSPCHPGPSII